MVKRKRKTESRVEKRARIRLERAINGWSEAQRTKDAQKHIVHKPGKIHHH